MNTRLQKENEDSSLRQDIHQTWQRLTRTQHQSDNKMLDSLLADWQQIWSAYCSFQVL